MAFQDSHRDVQADGSNVPRADLAEQPWSSGLFDCCQDTDSCLLGLFCPCVLFGKNVEKLHSRPFFGPCCIHCVLGGGVAFGASWVVGPAAFWLTLVSCYACGYRTEIRSKYHLQPRPCGDCATHFWCHPCAICQETREMKKRPAPPNLGFYGGGGGDVEMSAPPVPQMQS